MGSGRPATSGTTLCSAYDHDIAANVRIAPAAGEQSRRSDQTRGGKSPDVRFEAEIGDPEQAGREQSLSDGAEEAVDLSTEHADVPIAEQPRAHDNEEHRRRRAVCAATIPSSEAQVPPGEQHAAQHQPGDDER
jgi:hypothetical protein